MWKQRGESTAKLPKGGKIAFPRKSPDPLPDTSAERGVFSIRGIPRCKNELKHFKTFPYRRISQGESADP